jgi:hypothetical protein
VMGAHRILLLHFDRRAFEAHLDSYRAVDLIAARTGLRDGERHFTTSDRQFTSIILAR